MKLFDPVKRSIARLLVGSKSELRPVTSIVVKSECEEVFNFATVNHTYCLGNGVVVHNCDTVSMLSVMHTWRPSADIEMKYNPDQNIWEDIHFTEAESVGGLSSYVV